jgi:hypothetical protein
MKRLSLFTLLALISLGTFNSCTKETPLDPVAPTIELISGTGYVSSDTELTAGQTFTVRLRAEAGSDNLQSLGIYENDVLITPDRIKINGASISGQAIPITGGDVSGFTWDIAIVAHSVEDIRDYRFTIQAGSGSSPRSVVIAVSTIPQTVFDLTLRSGTGCFSSDATVDPQTLIKICPMGTRGSAGALQSLMVLEDNVAITDLSRLRFGIVSNNFSANPMTLPSQMASAIDTVVYIKVHSSGTKQYTIVLTDAAGNTKTQSLNISITPQGTPIASLSGVLKNSAGPTGTGGLDLDNGTGTGSSSSSAEIRDMGTAANWVHQIAPITANGVTLKSVSGVDFSSVAFVEDIISIYNSGTSISQSSSVSVGNVFAVLRGTTYYLIRVTAVNPTASDNDDSITFDIKK